MEREHNLCYLQCTLFFFGSEICKRVSVRGHEIEASCWLGQQSSEDWTKVGGSIFKVADLWQIIALGCGLGYGGVSSFSMKASYSENNLKGQDDAFYALVSEVPYVTSAIFY